MARPDSDGIDISHWNRITDWKSIPSFDLWCMKATEGRSFRSPVFDERWPKARELAKYNGAYHWLRSDSSALVQFNNFRKAINDHGGLTPGDYVMLDWETTPGIPDLNVAKVNQWIKLVEKEWPGRHIVYCSDWVPGFTEWRAANPDYPLWYANYNTGPSDRGGAAETDAYGADVWQWTSTALVPGFAAGIDMNDVLDWNTMDRIAGLDPIAEAPPTEPPPPATGHITYAPRKSWGLFPLDKQKPRLDMRAPRGEIHKPHVTYLQDAMNITSDGWFGPMTDHKVRQVQKFFGLTIDGVVGSQTWPVIDYLAMNWTP